MAQTTKCPNCGNRWEFTEWSEDKKSFKTINEKKIQFVMSQDASCEGGCCGGSEIYQCTNCMFIIVK